MKLYFCIPGPLELTLSFIPLTLFTCNRVYFLETSSILPTNSPHSAMSQHSLLLFLLFRCNYIFVPPTSAHSLFHSPYFIYMYICKRVYFGNFVTSPPKSDTPLLLAISHLFVLYLSYFLTTSISFFLSTYN